MKLSKMKLIFLAAFIAVSEAAKLDRGYLPPASAQSAGGNPSDLQAPLINNRNAPRGFNKDKVRENENQQSLSRQQSYSLFGNQKQNNNEEPNQNFNGNNRNGPPISRVDQNEQNVFHQNKRYEPLPRQFTSNNQRSQSRGDPQNDSDNPINYSPQSNQIFQTPSYNQYHQGSLKVPKYNSQGSYQPNSNENSGLSQGNGNFDDTSPTEEPAIPSFGTDQSLKYRQTGLISQKPKGPNQHSDTQRSNVGTNQILNEQAYKKDKKYERPEASQERSAEVVQLENDIIGDDFHYKFETDNGISAEAFGHAANGVQTQGGFSYIGDDGEMYTITYTADEGGYKPVGNHIPTPPPIPEAILRALEQNARDEAAGIIDDGNYDPNKYGYDESKGNVYYQNPQQYYSGQQNIERTKLNNYVQTANFADSIDNQDDVSYLSGINVANRNTNPQNDFRTKNNLSGRPIIAPSLTQQKSRKNPQQLSFEARPQLEETSRNPFLKENNNPDENTNVNYQKYNDFISVPRNPLQRINYSQNKANIEPSFGRDQDQSNKAKTKGPSYLPPKNSFEEQMTALNSPIMFQPNSLSNNKNNNQFRVNQFLNPSEIPESQIKGTESTFENQNIGQNLAQIDKQLQKPDPLRQQELNRKYPFGTGKKYSQELSIPSQNSPKNSPTGVTKNGLKNDLPSFSSATEQPFIQTTFEDRGSDECQSIQCLRVFQKNNNFDYGDTSELDIEQLKEYDEKFDINQFESQQLKEVEDEHLTNTNKPQLNFHQDRFPDMPSSLEPIRQSNARFQTSNNEIYNYPHPTQQYNDQQQDDYDMSTQFERTTEYEIENSNLQPGITNDKKLINPLDKKGYNSPDRIKSQQRPFVGSNQETQTLFKPGKFSPFDLTKNNIRENVNTQPIKYNQQQNSRTSDNLFYRSQEPIQQEQLFEKPVQQRPFSHDLPQLQSFDKSKEIPKQSFSKEQIKYQQEYPTENENTESTNQHIENQNDISKNETNARNQQMVSNNLRPQQYENSFKKFQTLNGARKPYFSQTQPEHQQPRQSLSGEQTENISETDENIQTTTGLPTQYYDGEIYQYNKPDPVPSDSNTTTEKGLENSTASSFTTSSVDYFTGSFHSNYNRYPAQIPNRHEEFPRFRKPPSYDDESGYRY